MKLWLGNIGHASLCNSSLVMAGLDPAIHVLAGEKESVDARVKPGHDDGENKGKIMTRPCGAGSP
ncbi:hypothetical protein WN72_38595 [Bradyrhizobium arachidis]|uniref:Uncharacterized protein n=1 Tax=Bradyrhizobium arachidis TaxID=858423 RepID=A0AAE7NWD6_9BRAD|nr:hypothetical protein WN72_38595 [Bradyrhizobium arachidis]